MATIVQLWREHGCAPLARVAKLHRSSDYLVKVADEEVFPTSVEPLRVQGTFRGRKNRHSSFRLDEELLDTEALSIEL